MKVCIVTTAFPRWENDGRAAFILEAAQAIMHQGNQVRVIAMHNPGSQTHEDIGGIEVIRPQYLPGKWEILQKDSAGLPHTWQNNPWSRLAILPFLLVHTLAVAKWTRGFDVIHANWTLSGASAWATQWFHRLPFVVTVQGSDLFNATKIWLPKKVTQHVLRRASKVIALSLALASSASQLGVPSDKICIIPNGVDINKFSFATGIKREPIILFVGSLIKRKGVELLLKAFLLIKDRLPEYRLIYIGEGDLRHSLEQQAQEHGLGQRVIFTGFQTQENVLNWLQRARVLVLPSLEEGLGVVLLEALACGTPCIGSNVGGIVDVVTPDVGKLVTPGDLKELSQAILEIIFSKEWDNYNMNARKRAEREYSWESNAKKILDIYNYAIMEKA